MGDVLSLASRRRSLCKASAQPSIYASGERKYRLLKYRSQLTIGKQHFPTMLDSQESIIATTFADEKQGPTQESIEHVPE